MRLDTTLAATRFQLAPVKIESIATGVPNESRQQSDTATAVSNLIQSNPDQRDRIHRIYANTCIKRRHMAVDPLSSTFNRTMGIRKRMELFIEHAVPLAVDVSQRAIGESQVQDPSELGMLVFVTSTGLVAPGADVAIAQKLGLSPSISRNVVNFMGCAAAINGLRVAADYIRCRANSKVLICCIELSTVNAVYTNDPNDVIISSLFGDGCAAMVVSSANREEWRAGEIIIRDQFSSLVDNTLDGIVLGINPHGITCELSPKLPKYIFSGLAPVIDEVLSRNDISRLDIQLWAIHPGGPKIIQESAHSLGLDPKVADHSWQVLAENGNMLSVGLPFVLKRMMESKVGNSQENGLAFSFAPGVSIEGFLFERVNSL